MAIMNMRQWRKAYMFEFLKGSEVEDVFTFSVPPESENLDFQQRVTETPTFGGVVIDDYGNDTVKIRLTGSTINEERKLIYRGNKKLPDYYTGEKEIFELQKLFEKWGELDNIPDKKVYIYDLSKMNLLQIGAGKPVQNYWRVINKGLKIKRDKSKPFTFNYELELIGIVDKEQQFSPLFGSSGLGTALEGVQKIVSTIETVCEITEAIADTIDTLAQKAVDVKKFIEKIQRGNLRSNTESIMRKFPGGDNLWNATKAVLSTCLKIQYLAGTSPSQIAGKSNYSRDDFFTVSYNSDIESYIPPARVSYGNCATKPDNLSNAKFKFIDWFQESNFVNKFDFSTEITKDITLYAKWEQIEATITFNSRQGSAVETQTVEIGKTAKKPENPTRQGYDFEYWCTDSLATAEFNFTTPITSDITLYARWKTVYAITFNSNGGSAVDTQMVGVGGKAVYPIIPTRENYLFGIWCIDNVLTNEYNFDLIVENNITLYAKWTRITNNVTFDSNGGSAVDTQVVNINGYAIKPPDPVKEGHTFHRWCSDTILTQEFIFTSTPINYPITIYAKWNVNIYTVQFESSGGTAVPNQSVEYLSLVVYPPVPEKAGAIFARWCIENSVENEETSEIETTYAEYDFSTPLTGDITLYAEWYEGAGG